MEQDRSYFERLKYFAFEEVKNHPEVQIGDEDYHLALVAVLLGTQGKEAFELLLPSLIKHLDPYKIREVIYQASAYLGFAKAYPFLKAFNSLGLELDDTMTTSLKDRLIKGNEVQIKAFGEGMRNSYKQGPMSYFLSANCFGDYYTRERLDLRQRELITLCFLYAQGACESQLKAHTLGNINVGNDKDYLIKVVHNMVPFVGYPRSLNAITTINAA